MMISNVTCTQIVPTLRFRAIVEHLVNPELKEEFQQDKCNWIPRTDTPEHKAYDNRTPGPFKEEWLGE